ncbi:uncharacterized protein TRUGW13939_02970 [Talaromyces rugulosus]|uniref:Meiotic expression up-regulated protein 6 PH domain-containing protein n=1 Tax=Talaromyces rugulosus TaxID=121627 RepID=A0A7H8QQY3_TALRU|nr:uncharacterized protein TRUGW13939_02970 [Talaromyces rugulosus]QKX55871.1 hypothetical protein TRUGW13939_02970 [Talaromyces rugulosus]
MSAEAPKIVEETPAAVPAVETPVETPAAAEPAAETPAEPATEAAAEAPAAEPAAETEAAAEAPKEEAKEEVTAATEGTLGYKGPGLVKSFRFAKRFFYFSDEAVEAKNLSTYLASEKASAAAQRTAAWATQTGKGLLFYTKRAEDKATPAGIFNLSEVSDVNKEGSNEFSFKTAGHKHTFQASGTERDSWVAALTAKTQEATAEKETITESEGFKGELEKLSKPAAVAAAAAVAGATAVKAAVTPEKDTKETEAAAEDKKEDKKEEKKEDKKSRSQSRKRASIFGSILGKKEKEEVKEETPGAAEETPAEAAPAEEAAAAEPAAATEATETPAAEAAPAETAAEATPAEEKKEEPKSATKSKRASIFGNFFNKVASPTKEKTEEEVVPVASTAPQLENPVDESAAKPIEPETVTDAPAAEAAAAETPAEEKKEEKKEEVSAETKEKRRTSIFGTLGKKVKAETGSDGEGKKAVNKLGGLFRKPSKAVKSEEKKDKEVAPAEEAIPEGEDKAAAPTEETPAATTEAAVEKADETAAAPAEPVNVAPAAAPVQAAA